MGKFKLVVSLLLILQHFWLLSTSLPSEPLTKSQSAYAQSSVIQSSDINTRDASAASSLGSLYRKSRQSRCVRCYDDRYNDDRTRGYSSYYRRTADDRANWYYPNERSSDRYDDRYRGGERDYDRYYRERDDRYAPRTYDRYEGRGYDRYDDRRGSYYDRSESRGSAYDNRDRYSTDRYGDYNRGDPYNVDRYYDRLRGSSGAGRYDSFDRDYYDRYYPRYDFRNYRPWDETYSGQSGFDSSGRGYYFATSHSSGRVGSDSYDESGRVSQLQRPLLGDNHYLPNDPRSTQPCGFQVLNCPYASGASSSESSPSYSALSHKNRQNANVAPSTANNPNQNTVNNGQSTGTNTGWNYTKDRETNLKGGDRGDRVTDRDQQSSSYGGRRPLGGSYLLDRETNVISDGETAAKEAVSNKPNTNTSKMVMGNGASNSAGATALSSKNQNQATSEQN